MLLDINAVHLKIIWDKKRVYDMRERRVCKMIHFFVLNNNLDTWSQI